MKKFWISWFHREHIHGDFELHWPWWTSGSGFGFSTICAAVIAENADAAKKIILQAFDELFLHSRNIHESQTETNEDIYRALQDKKSFIWRFCTEKPADWSPYSGRFPGAEWMKWESRVNS